jgi:hypothetical protein
VGRWKKWRKMEMGNDGDSGGGGMVAVKGGAVASWWVDGGVGDGGVCGKREKGRVWRKVKK